MALAIRLSRGGAKKRPFYRIVVADSRMPRDGRFIERLGSYDPMIAKDDPKRVLLNSERIRYWMSVGARPSARIAGFLYQAKLGPKPAIPEQTKQHKPRPRTLEKQKAREEKLAAAQQEAAAEAEKPAAEAKDGDTAAEPAKPEAAAEAEKPAAEAKDGDTAAEPAKPEAAAEAEKPAAEAKEKA